MADQARDIFRDYVTDGVPSSGVHNPRKAKIREWGTWVEAVIGAGSLSGAVWKETKALLDADLAHADGTIGVVYDDATAANNGMYAKSGASGSGSWTQIYDHLPGYQFVRAVDDGNSTANAITADSPSPIPSGDGNALILLVIPVTNTSGTVTVAFNGGTALAFKTAAGNNPATGGLIAGMTVLGTIAGDGTQFRMASDQASAAIQAAAEAAQAAAEAAAAKVPDVGAGDAGKFLVAKQDETGAEWVDVVHEVDPDLSSLITAPKRIKSAQERYSILDFGDARAQMATSEATRDMTNAWQKALSSGHPIFVPPGVMPFRSLELDDTAKAAVNIEGNVPIDVECSSAAYFVAGAEIFQDGGTPQAVDMFRIYRDSSLNMGSLDDRRMDWRGGYFDARALTTAYGVGLSLNGPGFMRVYRAVGPSFDGTVFDSGYQTAQTTGDDNVRVGCGFMDQGVSTHDCFGEHAKNRCIFKGFADLGWYISGDSGGADFSLPSGEEALIENCIFFRCLNAASSKRSFRNASFVGNRVTQCDNGFTDAAGGGAGNHGKRTKIIRNTLEQIRSFPIQLIGEDYRIVTDNVILNWGGEIADAGDTAVSTGVSAISLSSIRNSRIAGNIISLDGDWATNSGQQRAFWLKKHADYAYYSTNNEIVDNIINAVPQLINEETDCDNNRLDRNKLVGGNTVASVMNGLASSTSVRQTNREGLEHTIVSGAITLRGGTHVVLDTESDASSDTLETINGGAVGDLIVLSTINSGRDVTIVSGGGNIIMSGNLLLSTANDTITLVKATTNVWRLVSQEVNN